MKIFGLFGNFKLENFHINFYIWESLCQFTSRHEIRRLQIMKSSINYFLTKKNWPDVSKIYKSLIILVWKMNNWIKLYNVWRKNPWSPKMILLLKDRLAKGRALKNQFALPTRYPRPLKTNLDFWRKFRFLTKILKS